jgi:hypothetical protein
MFRIATFKIISEEVLVKVKSGETDQLVTVIDIPSTGNPFISHQFYSWHRAKSPNKNKQENKQKTPESVQTKSRQQ